MITNNNVINFQIQNGTSDFISTGASSGATVENMAVNLTGAFDLSNKGLNWVTDHFENASGDTVNRLRFVSKKVDGTFYMSDIIDWTKVISKNNKAYTVATEQITTIGYNGSTGSIQAISDNTYVMDVIFKSDLAFMGGRIGAPEVKYGRYDSPVSGTTYQYMVADGIATNLTANISKEIKDNLSNTIKIERLCSNAGVSVTTAGSLASLVWTNGSKYVEGNAVGVANSISNVVAGTYIMAASGTAVYKVVSFTQATASTAAIIELDQVYQGTTATIALATNKMVTAVLAAAADFGIKLTGLPQPFEVRNFGYEKTKFEVLLHDFGTTTAPTNSQEATPGVGTVEQVATAENELFGVDSLVGRLGVPPVVAPSYTNATGVITGYDTYYIKWYDNKPGSITGNPNNSYKELVIYSNQATGVVTNWQAIFSKV